MSTPSEHIWNNNNYTVCQRTKSLAIYFNSWSEQQDLVNIGNTLNCRFYSNLVEIRNTSLFPNSLRKTFRV